MFLALRRPRVSAFEARAAPSAGGGKRLIFKRAAAFQMTRDSVLSGAPAVRSKLLRAGGGSGGAGGRAARQALRGGIFTAPYFIFLLQVGLKRIIAQPGTTACSMEAVGMHQTRWGPVQAGFVAVCLSNNYPRHLIPTVSSVELLEDSVHKVWQSALDLPLDFP